MWLEYIITDDDTKIKKYISHPKYKPNGRKNIGGSLPVDIPEPNWYADPTHRAKCVAGSFFDLCKGKKSDTRATKLDAFRMKKYYSYYIKQNRDKGLSWLMEHAMAPLDHMFDDHTLCSSSWCHRKRKGEGGTISPSERDDKGYYRSKMTDRSLYEVMKEKYKRYISHNYLAQCCHLYDTQVNEGMNKSVAKYVPKGTNFCTTASLITRVYIAAGIQLTGHHFFWAEIMKSLELTINPQTELYLLDLDRRKLGNFCRAHDFSYMAKRKKTEHDKIRAHLQQAKRDRERNATYTAMTGCEPHGDESQKVSGGLAAGVSAAGATAVGATAVGAAKNLCVYAKFGCCGARRHKTNRSKLCKFYGRNKIEILGETFLF